jgi:hypothetical protein
MRRHKWSIDNWIDSDNNWIVYRRERGMDYFNSGFRHMGERVWGWGREISKNKKKTRQKKARGVWMKKKRGEKINKRISLVSFPQKVNILLINRIFFFT